MKIQPPLVLDYAMKEEIDFIVVTGTRLKKNDDICLDARGVISDN